MEPARRSQEAPEEASDENATAGEDLNGAWANKLFETRPAGSSESNHWPSSSRNVSGNRFVSFY